MRQRLRNFLTPTAGVDFTRSTTAIESTIGTTLTLSLTGTEGSTVVADRFNALVTRANEDHLLINNIVYVLQNNRLSS